MSTDWIQTYSGLKAFPFDLQEDQIEFDDIAHALSNLCRFAGHTKRFYSVAEHSVRGAWALGLDGWPPDVVLEFLLHDASEAYCVDLPRPIKRMLPEYKVLEYGVQKAICKKFGINYPFRAIVHEMDNRMLVTEAIHLLKNGPTAGWHHGILLEPLDISEYDTMGWMPGIAYIEMITLYNKLTGVLYG